MARKRLAIFFFIVLIAARDKSNNNNNKNTLRFDAIPVSTSSTFICPFLLFGAQKCRSIERESVHHKYVRLPIWSVSANVFLVNFCYFFCLLFVGFFIVLLIIRISFSSAVAAVCTIHDALHRPTIATLLIASAKGACPHYIPAEYRMSCIIPKWMSTKFVLTCIWHVQCLCFERFWFFFLFVFLFHSSGDFTCKTKQKLKITTNNEQRGTHSDHPNT